MKPFNVGIVGYGWAATAHADAIQNTRLGQVGAIYSSRASELDAAALSAQYGNEVKVYSDYDQMLADPSINVIDVTSYPSQHREQVLKAAAAGKHLIIEKPLALSLDDCKAMVKATEDAGVETCVCFECRHSGQFVTTKTMIDDGVFGDVHYGEIDYYHGVGPWYGQYRWNTSKENGGSSLLSAGCHALDALLMCMGGEVDAVTSYATQSKADIFQKYEYPTTTATIIRFADGRVGKTASVIDCLQPYYFHTHLVGSKGSMLDDKFYSSEFGALKKDGWSKLNMSLMDSGDVADHPYQTQFDVFFDSLEKKERMPLTSIQESFKTFEVIFAADKSVEEGREVKISELRS
ncbi:MAG: putative dehydrogenase [Verrucomicrobiales bacterium]|jgi:predicted dehydrogenase